MVTGKNRTGVVYIKVSRAGVPVCAKTAVGLGVRGRGLIIR